MHLTVINLVWIHSIMIFGSLYIFTGTVLTSITEEQTRCFQVQIH